MDNESVTQLIELLKKHRYAWIADEMVDVIEKGKLVEKDYIESGKNKKSSGLGLIPYTKDEEMAIAINILNNYLIVLDDVFEATREAIVNLPTDKIKNFKIEMEDSFQIKYDFFSMKKKDNHESIKEILGRLRYEGNK